MSLKYDIIEDLNLVLAVGEGVISFSELMDHIEQLGKDPKYKKPMKKLVDYRKVDSIQMSSSESETFCTPFALFVIGPTMPASGALLVHLSNPESQPSVTTTSQCKRTIYSPDDASMPSL